MYRVTFLGIVNFFELEPQGRLVLVPDGRKPIPDDIDPKHKIDEHNASFFIQCEDLIDFSNWWLPSQENEQIAQLHVRSLRIEKPSMVILSGMEEKTRKKEPFNDTAFESGIIRLREINEKIRIVPAEAKTIAQIPIRQGWLASRVIQHAIVAQLEVTGHTGPVTITAQPRDGSKEKTFTVKEGSEIVFANISDHMGPLALDPVTGEPDPEASHFRLYAQLDADRRVDLLRAREPKNADIDALGIRRIDPTHRFIQQLIRTGATPEGQCTITGCCSCLGRSEH